MTHVVTDSCIRCKYTDCVDVCPVDAFRAGKNMLVIDPDECIDCAVCGAPRKHRPSERGCDVLRLRGGAYCGARRQYRSCWE